MKIIGYVRASKSQRYQRVGSHAAAATIVRSKATTNIESPNETATSNTRKVLGYTMLGSAIESALLEDMLVASSDGDCFISESLRRTFGMCWVSESDPCPSFSVSTVSIEAVFAFDFPEEAIDRKSIPEVGEEFLNVVRDIVYSVQWSICWTNDSSYLMGKRMRSNISGTRHRRLRTPV